MYRLFTKPVVGNTGKIDHPSFATVQRNIREEIDKMIIYYRNSAMTVSTSHLCCQILQQLNVSMKRDLDSFMDGCYEEIERLANVFNLIHHDVLNPEPRDGLFYSKGITEFIVADESYFDHNLAYEKWDKLTPIKIHHHPFSDINYPMLIGNYKNPIRERGYAVISINIPMLALQYRAWLKNKSKIGDNYDKMESFILRYPIGNCVYRHTELAIMNRLMKKFHNEPVAKFYRLHPYNVADHTKIVDDLLNKRIDILKTRRVSFDELFSMFNTIYGKDWRHLADIPHVLHVRNTKWVLDLQVLKLITFWLQLNKAGNVLENRQIVNTLLRHLQSLENDAVYYKNVSLDLKNTFLILRRELEGN